jgi:hypothetical protein
LMISVRAEELWPHIPHQQRQCFRPGRRRADALLMNQHLTGAGRIDGQKT